MTSPLESGKIQDIMTKRIVTVVMDDSLETVKEIFEQTRFHHLLVISADKLVGVISDRDYLKAVSPNIGTLAETRVDSETLNKRVHQIMSRDPKTLGPDDTIMQAVRLFNEYRFSCIPIIDKVGKPTGIVSWRDIFKYVARHFD